MNKFLTLSLVIINVNFASSQIFKDTKVIPKVKSMEVKHFDRSKEKEYISVHYFDDKGRETKQVNLLDDIPVNEFKYTYNNHDDVIKVIHKHRSLGRAIIDSTVFRYKYENGFIIYQSECYSETDSLTYTLTALTNDSTFLYASHAHTFSSVSKRSNVQSRQLTIQRDKNNNIISWENRDLGSNNGEIKSLSYYPTGHLRSRFIERLPKEVNKETPTTTFYEYTYDRFGRVDTQFIVTGKKRKRLASFKYVE